jgi:hypothetical protein
MSFRRKKEETPLDREIEAVFQNLDRKIPGSDEYKATLDNLSMLYALREPKKPLGGVTPDTIVIAATNIAGIAMILQHERLHAISTKAFNFILKMH